MEPSEASNSLLRHLIACVFCVWSWGLLSSSYTCPTSATICIQPSQTTTVWSHTQLLVQDWTFFLLGWSYPWLEALSCLIQTQLCSWLHLHVSPTPTGKWRPGKATKGCLSKAPISFFFPTALALPPRGNDLVLIRRPCSPLELTWLAFKAVWKSREKTKATNQTVVPGSLAFQPLMIRHGP